MVSRSSVLLLATVLLASPVLAGCLGLGGDEAAAEDLAKQRAEVSQDTGGIQGVVTDEAVQPLAGANVTLVETSETVRTASDGSFAFSHVRPGTYTVSVSAADHVSSQQEVSVRAGQAAVVDFLLTRLVSDDAYTQQIEFAAFFECGIGVGWNITDDVPGGTFGVTWATCATLNLGGNTTNDDFSENVALEAPIETLVWEAQWDPSGNTLAENLWLVADIQGHAGITAGNQTVHVDFSAASPFRAQVDRPHFENISAYFQERCEGTGEEEQDDSFCGYNFWDKGWPITVRTFTATDCAPTPASACAPLQLKVDHVYSAFYNAPAPAGFSVFGGGA